MKNKLFVMMILIMSLNAFTQEVYQQTYLEFNEEMQSHESYTCQATTSIKLLPGFSYEPEYNKSMSLEIDRYSVFPPTDGSQGGMSSDYGGVVGSLSGSFNVSNTGAAVYSIDIKLPDAIGTMKPKLSLVYNNQGANGIMGWAWELTGLSSITRTGQTEYHDGMITYVDFVNDKFLLDGQHLMLVNGSKYGADNSEYKTEIDNMDKIVSYTNNNKSPQYFVVWRNDGTIWEYGTTDDSRVENKSDGEIVLKWMLSKIYDRSGNAIIFKYDKDVDAGEAYIDNIQYTLNEDAHVDPVYNISFVYENNRLDISYGYMYGNKFVKDRLLKNILVHNNHTGKLLYDYSIDYYNPGLYGNHKFIYHRVKSVGLTAGNENINPTRIIWNAEKNHYPSDNDDYITYQLDKSVFNQVPFIGDFNGDGFSDVLLVPYKIQNTYPNDIEGEVYINNGDGSFQITPMTTIRLSKKLEWIYIVDINDDGKDDIIPFEYDYDIRSVDDLKAQIHIYVMKDQDFVKKASYSYKNATLLTGKFSPTDDKGVVVIETFGENNDDKKIDYIYYNDDEVFKSTIIDMYDINYEDASYMAMDVSGDGICELMVLKENAYQIFMMKHNGVVYYLDLFSTGNSITKDMYLFPNDYNGDGKTDLLLYNTSRSWKMALSKGNGSFDLINDSHNTLLNNVTLNDKDRYRYSLKEIQKPSVTIRTADFDGDGVADIGVFKSMAGNYYLELGLKPYVKYDNKFDFIYESRYYLPINYSHQTIHIGGFLAQENVSILSTLPREPYYLQKASIVSLYPHSKYYSVERIVDGMGNARGFSYDYLMHKNDSNEFYTCSNYTTYNDIRKTSVPIRALKSDTLFSINETPVINKYFYKNALIHTKGHGFLGLETIVVKNYVDGNIIKKKVSDYEIYTMGLHCISLPSTIKSYNGENKLLNERFLVFKKYCCSSNEKVIMPLLEYNYEINHNPDKYGDVLKKVITKNEYISDKQTEMTYHNVVSHSRNILGFTDDFNVMDPDGCLYIEKRELEYKNDLNDWIINRPIRILCLKQDAAGGKVGCVVNYVYDEKNPDRILKETKTPNHQCDYTDPLSISIEYEYDKLGNMIYKSETSPSVAYKKMISSEYGELYNYMYKTKTIDGAGREIRSMYDQDYGFLTSTIDYNGFVTFNEKDPFGINDVVILPDGMVKARSLRWSEDNEHAPIGAAYYSWDKSTGSAESMVFYHKSGVELRSVMFDVNGNAIYVDKRYDDYGNVIEESLPYYKNDVKLFITNVYDKFNRLVEKRFPDGRSCNIYYDGNTVMTECFSIEGNRQTKKETYNIMGWLISMQDTGGNEIIYDYYEDGLIKSAAIAGNYNSKISVTYDNSRNRKTLHDPNYGLMLYQYDAFGNIIKVTNPKGEIIEFKYDMLGRLQSRIVSDGESKDVNTTKWFYDEKKGKNGMLMKVCSDNHQINYNYDNNLRLLNTIETIDGNEYKTEYTYDHANRQSSIKYSSGIVVSKVYSNSGYEKEIYDKENNCLLWRTHKTMADGSITEYELGNGVITKMLYNPRTSLVERIMTYDDNITIQDLMYDYDGWGNMKRRSKLTGVEFCEEFEYDEFDRLVSVNLNGNKSSMMVYDYLGNVITKEDNGINVLYSTRYDQKRPNAIIQAKTDDEKMSLGFSRDMKYSVFDNLNSIVQHDDFLRIDYGCSDDRISMRSCVNGINSSKLYVGDCEFVTENSFIRSYTYIKGPMGVFAVFIIDENDNKTINYVHKDNLGSWNIITDGNAEIIQDVSFDAWGNIRDGNDWSNNVNDCSLICDRGFTGHEHLLSFGLINMNGRMYDPMMSMMLSPDNNIQLPQVSQNFNRYSYCLNNPLKYNDPTGEWVESIVFGIVGGAANLVMNARNIDSFGEGALLFGVGFVKGFLTEYTMGQSWFLQIGVKTLMGGLASGVNQMVSIGDGSFKFSGDEWNCIKTAAHYAIGNGIVKNIMHTYMAEPTETQYGDSFFDSCLNPELMYGLTSLAAHGMGCWFSGQDFLSTMRFKDVGFDLKMLGIIAERLLVSYICDSEFAEYVVSQRAHEIKNSVLSDIRTEDPDHPDIEVLYQLKGACVDRMRLYVVCDVFTLLPGEMLEVYPIPFLEEIVSFPFSYSLFRTLFLNY